MLQPIKGDRFVNSKDFLSQISVEFDGRGEDGNGAILIKLTDGISHKMSHSLDDFTTPTSEKVYHWENSSLHPGLYCNGINNSK